MLMVVAPEGTSLLPREHSDIKSIFYKVCGVNLYWSWSENGSTGGCNIKEVGILMYCSHYEIFVYIDLKYIKFVSEKVSIRNEWIVNCYEIKTISSILSHRLFLKSPALNRNFGKIVFFFL